MKRFATKIVLTFVLVLSSLLPIGGAFTATVGSAPAFAAAADPCPTGSVQLSVPFSHDPGANCVSGSGSGGVIVAYLVLVLKLLAGAVGAVVVLMLIIAGIQYITSTGDPTQVKAAKTRITNALTALVLFLFMYAILNFLIPGGVFH